MIKIQRLVIAPTTLRGILLLFVISVAGIHSVVGSNNNAPVCLNEAKDDCNDKNEDSCPIWYYEGWMLAGEKFLKNQTVGYRDIVIPWKQHSRRGFPLWRRSYYFFPGSSGLPYDFIFAPGYSFPFECHSRYDNLRSGLVVGDRGTQDKDSDIVFSSRNEPLRADRVIGKGDPLFLPCHDKSLSAGGLVSDFPQISNRNVLEHRGGACFNPYNLEVKKSNVHGWGLFNGQTISANTVFAEGPLLHMHRTELFHPEGQYYERLLNYCFGNAQTSLLLLPLIPFVNAINHDREPNVRIQWAENNNGKSFFNKPSEKLFQDSEEASLSIIYVTLREISKGEEILLDYGEAWQRALDEHLQNPATTTSSMEERMDDFRHEITLSDDFFPSEWLEAEITTMEYPDWEMKRLMPGELSPARLTTGRTVGSDIRRIGLPHAFSEKVANWSKELGMTDILKSYILGGNTLPENGQERIRINGGRWWMKRFPKDWESNMHYITPDDDESFNQFMKALNDAGFDKMMEAIGEKDNLQSLTCYYPAFIAVSHCTRSLIHTDSDDRGHYNLIFPIIQAENDTNPELIIGDDDESFFVPYKYETENAVVLGEHGQHGSAPCDYRGTNQIRIVVSVYMADFTDEYVFDQVLRGWEDPPYPAKRTRKQVLANRKHWVANSDQERVS